MLYKQFTEQVLALRQQSARISVTAAPNASVSSPPQAAPKAEVNLIQYFGIRKPDLKPEMIEARRSHPRAYESWTEEEENAVEQVANRQMNAETIARLLGRQPSAIERKLKELGYW
ncbi:hypothetical protein [Corallococcus sp. EGB]|uniref:hypothetical protein n=1 Tax=Corallococcus sp. EGB TaxID=1521117 RepID=UPI001CBC2E96|nr:hypothetical protein [Corallococcus sp. EGB]